MKPWSEFKKQELLALPEIAYSSVPIPSVSFSPVKAIPLEHGLVYVDSKSGFFSSPSIYDTRQAVLVAQARDDGPTFSVGAEQWANTLNTYIAPYSLVASDGVWMVRYHASQRYYAPAILFSGLMLETAERRDQIAKFNKFIDKYVNQKHRSQGFELCVHCSKKDLQHLLCHVERGELDDALIRTMTGTNKSDWQPGAWRVALRDSLRTAFTSMFLWDGLMWDGEHFQVLKMDGWRARGG